MVKERRGRGKVSAPEMAARRTGESENAFQLRMTLLRCDEEKVGRETEKEKRTNRLLLCKRSSNFFILCFQEKKRLKVILISSSLKLSQVISKFFSEFYLPFFFLILSHSCTGP